MASKALGELILRGPIDDAETVTFGSMFLVGCAGTSIALAIWWVFA